MLERHPHELLDEEEGPVFKKTFCGLICTMYSALVELGAVIFTAGSSLELALEDKSVRTRDPNRSVLGLMLHSVW